MLSDVIKGLFTSVVFVNRIKNVNMFLIINKDKVQIFLKLLLT